MEYNQDLTTAYVTVKVNGGTNVLRNIFHFNSEAIEDAFRNEFNDIARLTDFVAVSAAQVGASISYADERAVLMLGLSLNIECDESNNNFDYAESLLSIVYPEQFVKELSQATTIESLIPHVVAKALHDLSEGDDLSGKKATKAIQSLNGLTNKIPTSIEVGICVVVTFE